MAEATAASGAVLAVAVGVLGTGVTLAVGVVVGVSVSVSVSVGVRVSVGVAVTTWATLILSGSVRALATANSPSAHRSARRPNTGRPSCQSASSVSRG